MFLENELLYGQKFKISAEAQSPDYTVPIGKAKVEREGKDITLISFSRMVGHCLEAAEQLASQGISAEACLPLFSLTPPLILKRSSYLIKILTHY